MADAANDGAFGLGAGIFNQNNNQAIVDDAVAGPSQATFSNSAATNIKTANMSNDFGDISMGNIFPGWQNFMDFGNANYNFGAPSVAPQGIKLFIHLIISDTACNKIHNVFFHTNAFHVYFLQVCLIYQAVRHRLVFMVFPVHLIINQFTDGQVDFQRVEEISTQMKQTITSR